MEEKVQTSLSTANPPKGGAVLDVSGAGALGSDPAPVNSSGLVTNWLLL